MRLLIAFPSVLRMLKSLDGVSPWKPPELPIDVVIPIIKEVREKGLEALRKLSIKFDGKFPEDVYGEPVPGELPDFIKEAVGRLERCSSKFLNFQPCEIGGFRTKLEVIRDGSLNEPVERVGIYVPGGRYPLPSSLMMASIPAKAAGVDELVIATPPREFPLIEHLARELGVREVLRVGGAHGVAALAFGIPEIGLEPVDMIVGPGGAYVTAAKKVLSDMGVVKIDLIAGPSEIVVVADRGDPRTIALDLLAQAEHGPDSPSLLLTTDRKLAEEVLREVNSLKGDLPLNLKVAYGDKEGIARVVNKIMPEHLEVFGEFPDMLAGAVFREVGVVFGDYGMTGANHILPTGSSLLERPGLSPLTFLGYDGSYYYLQEGDLSAQSSVAEITAAFARVEGLEFHARSAEARKLNNGGG